MTIAPRKHTLGNKKKITLSDLVSALKATTKGAIQLRYRQIKQGMTEIEDKNRDKH